jgi:menaquinol-cytochrome c reductase iron-sulfur subunit
MDDKSRASSPQQSLPPTRRNFSAIAIHGIWAVIIAALGGPAAAYLLIPAKFRRKNDFVEAGDITQLRPQVPLEVAFRRNRVDGWRVVSEKSTAWVVKLPDNNVVAYAPQCTHLGCAYHWDQRRTRFVCPCHNSVFSVDGKVQEGPAPRPLDRYQTRIEGNKLLLGPVQPSSAETV